MTKDEDDLWAAAIADVKPLKQNQSREKIVHSDGCHPAVDLPEKEANTPVGTPKNTPMPNMPNDADLYPSDAHLVPNSAHEMPTDAHHRHQNAGYADPRNVPPLTITSNESHCIAGHAEGVDGKLRTRLARGEFKVTGHLDLHGYLEGDAWLAVMDYLHEAYDREHRCVIIVHGKGKGYGQNQDMGIIKFQIGKWVAHHPRVLAFHTATPKDGGTGALYVYLRRRRV